MYHFQILWKCSAKLNNIPFLKTYCMWVLKLHIFSMGTWELYQVSLSFSCFSSPVAPDILFNTFLLGLITLTFVFYRNFPLMLTVRWVDFLMKCTSNSLFTLSWVCFGEKWGRNILKIKFKLLLKMSKEQTAHLSKSSTQWKRPAGRERQVQPMWVGRWKGLVRPFQSQELKEIFAPTVITLPSPHSLQLSLGFFSLSSFQPLPLFFPPLFFSGAAGASKS